MFFMVGCASKVEVILLPQEDGKVGEVTITDNNKTVSLNKAWQRVETKNLSNKEILSKELVSSKYKELLEALPDAIKNYRLYFKFDSSAMTKSSRNTLKQIISDIKSSSVLQIDIVGYSDRAGDDKYNKILSKKRAKNVKKLLKAQGIDQKIIKLEYYGEKNPIVHTADGVAKKINRRVEVTIK